MRDSFVKKVVFSSSPGDDGKSFVAVCILNQTGDLAYCKKGESVWRFIDGVQAYCEDVVYHKGCFYAVSKYGNIAVCDVSGDVADVSLVDTHLQAGGDMQYLVSLGDELLLVTRYLELGFDVDQDQLDVFYKTTEFCVFKLVVGGAIWESVVKLDEWALFLGENSSMAFRACDFEGCKGNSIYFTDDYSEWNYDVDWSELHPELIFTISQNLKIHKDYIRCGSSHGYLVILEETPEVLMINPLTRVKHSLPPLTSFPNVTKFDKYDIGREYTLRTLDGDVYSCSLKEMRDSFVKKVVFSSSPGDDEYFIEISEDPKTMNDQSNDTFWYKVLDIYNELTEETGCKKRGIEDTYFRHYEDESGGRGEDRGVERRDPG
nr:hypothetical protein [Tanacetum cinerariifolium]